MKFTSGHITQASGSVGGLTYSRNRYGMYVRAKAMPVNPNTALQQAAKNRLAQLTVRWRETLTSAQRDAWAEYALNTPTTDRLGRSQTITGMNWYVACNTLRLQAGLTVVDAGPVIFGLADLTAPTFSIDASADTCSVGFTNTDEWANEVGGALLVFASGPKNASINYFGGPYKYLGKATGGVSPPESPQVLNLVDLVDVANSVFCRAVGVRADGRITAPFRVKGTVVA